VLAIPKLGAINVHASLLPKYRGAAPVAHAILNGETETGVTIIRITPGLDAGEMLAQAKLQIGSDASAGGLEHRLARIGDQLAVDVVHRMKLGPIAGEAQNSALATKAPKITKEMGLIDWMKTATEIKNQIRAMSPWPSAYTFFHRPGKEPMRVIIQSAQTEVREPARAGTIEIRPDLAITIATIDGAISIRRLQPAGKKMMSAEEFLRGYPITEGCRFGPEQLP
jgi:methionyl-tRNA formyltransferase